MKALMRSFIGFFLVSIMTAADASAPLFTVSLSGNNGLVVNTTVMPRKQPYYYAGMKSPTVGVSFLGCESDPVSGLCKIDVNTTYSPDLSFQGINIESNTLDLIFCLNRNTSKLNCEQHTLNLPGLAYVINYNGSSNFVLLCKVSSTGGLSQCADAGSNATTDQDLRQIVINRVGTIAYLVKESTSVGISACPINQATAQLSGSCSTTTFGSSRAMVFTSDQQYAYIMDGVANNIQRCAVNTTNGVLQDCVSVKGSLTVPTGIALYTFPTGSYVYYTEAGGVRRASYCNVNSSTGALESCDTPITTGLDSPEAISINPSGTFAYITNSTNTNNGSTNIRYCSINQLTGALENSCSNTAIDLVGKTISAGPTRGEVTFSPDGKKAYFGSFNENKVYSCDVLDSGAFSNCQDSGVSASLLSSPSGVALVHSPTF